MEDMRRQYGEDRKTIEAADERITHQIARRIEQDERKKKSEDITDHDQEEAMHEDAVGKEEDGHMPTKRVIASETSEKEMSDQIYENPVTPDVTMEEEKSQEEDTTLGR